MTRSPLPCRHSSATGLAAAAAVFRRMDARDRAWVLDIILDYWLQPALALRIGLDDDLIERAGQHG